jgi:hypothetical protein
MLPGRPLVPGQELGTQPALAPAVPVAWPQLGHEQYPKHHNIPLSDVWVAPAPAAAPQAPTRPASAAPPVLLAPSASGGQLVLSRVGSGMQTAPLQLTSCATPQLFIVQSALQPLPAPVAMTAAAPPLPQPLLVLQPQPQQLPCAMPKQQQQQQGMVLHSQAQQQILMLPHAWPQQQPKVLSHALGPAAAAAAAAAGACKTLKRAPQQDQEGYTTQATKRATGASDSAILQSAQPDGMVDTLTSAQLLQGHVCTAPLHTAAAVQAAVPGITVPLSPTAAAVLHSQRGPRGQLRALLARRLLVSRFHARAVGMAEAWSCAYTRFNAGVQAIIAQGTHSSNNNQEICHVEGHHGAGGGSCGAATCHPDSHHSNHHHHRGSECADDNAAAPLRSLWDGKCELAGSNGSTEAAASCTETATGSHSNPSERSRVVATGLARAAAATVSYGRGIAAG